MAAMLGCAQSYYHQITTAARNLQGRHPHDRLRKQRPPKSLVAVPNRSSFAKICPATMSATLDPFGLISWLGIFRIFGAGDLGSAFGRSIPIRITAVKGRNDQPTCRRGNANSQTSQLRRGFAFPLPQSAEVWCKGSGTEMHLSSTFRRDSTSLINSNNRFAKRPF
jgi:hypothetical protein